MSYQLPDRHGQAPDPVSAYRAEVLRTAGVPLPDKDRWALGALGLAGESGEVVDLLKKHLFHGKPLDIDKLIMELGDVRWYLEVLAYMAGVSMEEIERRNVEKLRLRYPNGFKKEGE